MSEPLVRLRGVDKVFRRGGESIHVLRGLDLDLRLEPLGERRDRARPDPAEVEADVGIGKAGVAPIAPVGLDLEEAGGMLKPPVFIVAHNVVTPSRTKPVRPRRALLLPVQ